MSLVNLAPYTLTSTEWFWRFHIPQGIHKLPILFDFKMAAFCYLRWNIPEVSVVLPEQVENVLRASIWPLIYDCDSIVKTCQHTIRVITTSGV